jgi:hypothetical protein
MSRHTSRRARAGAAAIGVVIAGTLGFGLGGAPAGAQANGPGDPLYGDINGDGRTDRVTLDDNFGPGAVCELKVELGKKHGRFRHPKTYTYPAPGTPLGICQTMGVIVDLGGDGQAELVLAWWTQPEGVDYELTVLRDFTEVDGFDAENQPSAIGIADFNGDGLIDVYEYTDQGSGFLTYLNTPDSQLVPGPLHHCHNALFASGYNYELADFDEDGAMDVAFGFYEGCEPGAPFAGVAVVLDDGTATYLQSDDGSGDVTWTAAATDANGDGHVDVVTTASGTGGGGVVTTFYGHGDGTFATS